MDADRDREAAWWGSRTVDDVREDYDPNEWVWLDRGRPAGHERPPKDDDCRPPSSGHP